MKAILTKFIPATNTKPARIKALDGDNSVMVPYYHDQDNDQETNDAAHWRACNALKAKLGWTGEMAGGHTKTGMVFVFLKGGGK